MLIYDPKNDFYAKLEIDDTAIGPDIKRAYREKAKLYHPDGHREPALATKAMTSLNEAYEVLSDPRRRQVYDRLRTEHRLREHEGEIQRRVAEAMRAAPVPPPRNGSTLAKRYKARKDSETRQRVEDRAAAPSRRVNKAKSASLGLVAPHQSGAFTRLAESKVNSLLREDKPVEAMLYGVGAAMLDAWLGTRTQHRPR